MTDRDPTQQSEHEKRVAEEMEGAEAGADRTEKGGLTGLTEPTIGDVGQTPYDREVEAEQQGTTADRVRGEEEEDERTPIDSAYQPRTGS